MSDTLTFDHLAETVLDAATIAATQAAITNASSPFAMTVQDAIKAAATKIGGFKNLFDTPMETVQPRDLPALAVFIVEEDMRSAGNGMAGEPRFIHDLAIGVQAVLVSSDAEDQRIRVMAALGRLDQAILTDQPTLQLIENVQSIRRTFKYERVAEVPIVQLNELIHISYESDWPPIVVDDYLRYGALLAWPLAPFDDSLKDTQIKVGWDIDQSLPPPRKDKYDYIR